MAKILIVGLKPGLTEKSKSVTWNRVAEWIEHPYDWTNIYDLDDKVIFNPFEAYKYKYIIALGNVSSGYMTKLGIQHLKIPHPSRLNRQWNDPKTEITTKKRLKKYLQTHENVL